jgi:hypothetical protein
VLIGQESHQFTDEFKRAMVPLASSGWPLTQIGMELDIDPSG